MENCILITTVGKTDPIREQHDGPILHIVRHYSPERVVMLFSDEIGRLEEEYHYNEQAIHMLSPDCQVDIMEPWLEDVYSYDTLLQQVLKICNDLKMKFPDKKLLLNIASGTPQLKTVLCMIAISDLDRYVPIQVLTPMKSSNRSNSFEPRLELIEEWFETDLDNIGDEPSRCELPKLMNFRRPIAQFQIESLIGNYDYAGAYQLYMNNHDSFSEEAGLLLRHAKSRVNLEFGEAEKLARDSGMERELYPIANAGIRQLMEYYLSIKIKQARGELNDMSMRVEVFTLYTALYMLEKCMHIQRENITVQGRSRGSYIMRFSKEKSEEALPGITGYLNSQFRQMGSVDFEWGKPINALSMALFAAYACENRGYDKYRAATLEIIRWTDITAQVRNPVAHSITAITDDEIKAAYGGSSREFCAAAQNVLIQIFGREVKAADFNIYNKINEMIKNALEK